MSTINDPTLPRTQPVPRDGSPLPFLIWEEAAEQKTISIIRRWAGDEGVARYLGSGEDCDLI